MPREPQGSRALLEQLVQLFEKLSLCRLIRFAQSVEKILCRLLRNIFAEVALCKRDVQPTIGDPSAAQVDEVQAVLSVDEHIMTD